NGGKNGGRNPGNGVSDPANSTLFSPFGGVFGEVGEIPLRGVNGDRAHCESISGGLDARPPFSFVGTVAQFEPSDQKFGADGGVARATGGSVSKAENDGKVRG